jgi:hypothetical protein
MPGVSMKQQLTFNWFWRVVAAMKKSWPMLALCLAMGHGSRRSLGFNRRL